MKANFISLIFLLSALLLSLAPAAILAANCNVSELSPCSAAFYNGAKPTGACCARIRDDIYNPNTQTQAEHSTLQRRKMKANFISLIFLLSALLLSLAPAAILAGNCDISELNPCSTAFFNGAEPTGACCVRLREQKPCFCQYQSNPSLKVYVNSANGRRVSSYCHVDFPNC